VHDDLVGPDGKGMDCEAIFTWIDARAATREKAEGTTHGPFLVFRSAFSVLPFPLSPFPLPAPLHEQIDSPVVDLPKPEPLVEPQRGMKRSTWMLSDLPAAAASA
jgi:hypothetical protein